MLKKLFALILCMALLASAVPVHAASTPVLRVETVRAEAGDTVDVYIQIENNPGISSIKLNVTFDPKLTLTGVAFNSALGGVTQPPEFYSSPFIINWLNFMSNVTGDTYYAKLTFQVAANAPEGTFPISITYNPEDVFNLNEQNVNFSIINGGVTVVDCLHRSKTETAAKASTCKVQGWNAYKTCNGCGQLFSSADQMIDAIPLLPLSKNHTGGTATCQKKAVCTICGVSYGELAGHTYEKVVTAPTCTADGFTTYTCKLCKHSYTDSVVSAHGHSYKKVVTAPTCTTGGYTTNTCSACGHSYRSNEVAKLGHTYKKVVTAPTCTIDGYTTYTCKTCKNTYTDDVIQAPGHSYKKVVTAPTCTTGGYTTNTCSACGHSYRSNEIAKLGHAYKKVVTAPTCTTDGYTTNTCSRCSDKYVDAHTGKLGHTGAAAVRENETRNTYESVVYCKNCHIEMSRELVVVYIPGDINGDGVVNNKDATRLFQYASGWKVTVNTPALDVNGDGQFNNKDATRLFQYVSGWKVTIY